MSAAAQGANGAGGAGRLPPDLSGQCALVTGGNRGIGKALALALARHGARVAICGRNATTIAATVAELNALTPGAFGRICDVRDEGQQLALFAAVRDTFGQLDICIPNAGEATLASATETTLEQWRRDLDTNLTGTYLTCREALKMMKLRRSGWIIPVISQAGTVPFLLRAAYCASKWGALGFTKCLALEAKQYEVRVTALCPASVATDFQSQNPMGMEWMLDPGDVAQAMLSILNLSPKAELDELVLRCRQKPAKK